MNNRLIRRLSVASAVAVTALSGLVAPLAHADTLPGNTPSVPFPAASYSNGCSFPGPNLLFDTSPPLVDPSPWAWPYVFVAIALWLSSAEIQLIAAILIAHVGMDRAVGYGLKLPSSFQDTHLGRMGRAKA